jgi:hypothetical protein
MKRAFLALPLVLFACASTTSDPSASSDSDLHLEEAPLPTALTELKAGLPYLPGIDESPLAIGAPCVADPKVTITTGQVGSTAAVVQSRDSLSRELGFSISGTIPVAGGITGAAGLTYTTSFDSESAVVLFQSTGTYESVLTGASAMQSYDADSVSRCGFGYVARASHRVTAALVVSVRSTANSSDFKANAGLGKSGIAEAKANIGNLIERGEVEIAIHFATDVIPDLPKAPFADSVIVVGKSDADKANAQQKLDRSLGWLADAQHTIEGYLLNLRAHADQAPPAPAQSIVFRYYPGTPTAVRKQVDTGVTAATDTKTALRKARASLDAWQQYEKASADGVGYEWNIPLAPAKTVAELDAKKSVALGALRPYEQKLSDDLDACLSSLRNDRSAIEGSCVAPNAFPIDERANDIRHIAYLTVDTVRGGNPGCPDGQRFPKESEAPLFSPWSKARRAVTDEGLWMAESHCTWSSGWIYDGEPGCSSAWSAQQGLRICVSDAAGPMPSEP